MFEEGLLEFAEDGEAFEAAEDGGVELDDLVLAGLAVEVVFAHVAAFFADVGEGAGALFEGITADGFGELAAFVLVDVVEDFFGGAGAVNFLEGVEDLGGEIAELGGEEDLGGLGEAVGFFGAAHAFGAAPSIEVTFFFEGDAVLFDTHVGEADAVAEFGDRKALTALDLGEDDQLGIFGHFLEEFAFHGWKWRMVNYRLRLRIRRFYARLFTFAT